MSIQFEAEDEISEEDIKAAIELILEESYREWDQRDTEYSSQRNATNSVKLFFEAVEDAIKNHATTGAYIEELSGVTTHINGNGTERNISITKNGAIIGNVVATYRVKEEAQEQDTCTFTQGIREEARSVTVNIPQGYTLVQGRKSHGQSVYTNGNSWISPDTDGHNGGMWKKAGSLRALGRKETRDGTYDENLNKVGE